MVRTLKKYGRKSISAVQNEGLLGFGIKVLTKLQKKQLQISHNTAIKKKFVSLVDRQQVMAADWVGKPYVSSKRTHPKPYTINWVMSPPSGGGGHQNIFRFIEFLDKQGHANNVYIYSTYDDMTLAQARENVSSYCSANLLQFFRHGEHTIEGDILFATGWETAYPVFNEKTDARKLYFIQDFEPYFYPMGTDYMLAENTYKFGFHGITAGGWLSDKLTREYGMNTDHYNFGADKTKYHLDNHGERKKIFFYARPVTERRGFDLGVMVLELFHNARPDYTIVMAGWDVSEYDIPFPYVNQKALPIDQLSATYNECAAALVLSLTNMSLLPLELLACGTIPVVNDGPNNRLVDDNPYIAYVDAAPQALADALIKIVDNKNAPAYATEAAASVAESSWDVAGKKFITIIDEMMKS